MSWMPAFEVGLGNAWLFMIVYPLQWLAVVVLPPRISQRTSHAPEIIGNRKDRVISLFTQGCWLGATLYSIFLPLQTGAPGFWAGLALFAAGLAILVMASFAVAATPANKPFTSGVYRFSRHPMYFSMLLIYSAVTLASLSWLFAVLTLLTFFLQRYQLTREEEHCLIKFGPAYRDYMQATARWVGWTAKPSR